VDGPPAIQRGLRRTDAVRLLDSAGRPSSDLTDATSIISFAADRRQSEKSWIADPQGVPWETFLTTDESTVHGADPVSEQPKQQVRERRLRVHGQRGMNSARPGLEGYAMARSHICFNEEPRRWVFPQLKTACCCSLRQLESQNPT
jgi:hypothetical protein